MTFLVASINSIQRAELTDFDVTLRVQEYVVAFDVSMDDTLSVEVL